MKLAKMIYITSDQFNASIVQFKELLLLDLYSTIPFKVRSHSIRLNTPQECYMFMSLLLPDVNVRIDFTISYHPFYNVPIFHCRIFLNDETLSFDVAHTRLLLREKYDLSNMRKEMPALNGEDNVEVLIGDHHLLQLPWLQIHPCETMATVDMFMNSRRCTIAAPSAAAVVAAATKAIETSTTMTKGKPRDNEYTIPVTKESIDEIGSLGHSPSLDPVSSTIEYLTCWFGLYALPAIFPYFSLRPIAKNMEL